MRSEKYLKFVRSLSCYMCERPGPSEAHHAIDVGLGGIMGGKASDLHAMPACQRCHSFIHADSKGAEQAQLKGVLKTQQRAIHAGVLPLNKKKWL